MDDNLHNELLDNTNADNYGRIQTFIDYIQIGFKPDEALKIAGFKNVDIETEPILRAHYLTAKKKEKNMDNLIFDTGMPSDLNQAYGKIMDNYYFTFSHNKDHKKTIEELSSMFGYKQKILSEFTLKHRYEFIKSHYPEWLHLVETKTKINQMWDGYCPESLLIGRQVRMRLNKDDFFESEETGLQISVFGTQAIILNFRGEGNFRTTITYANDIENGEILSPQNTENPPFNNPIEVFTESEQIENYINSIPKNNFDIPFISDISITELLKQKVEIEQKIETRIKEKGFAHFSSKKFVGDLGEYYAKINLSHLFVDNELHISEISNSLNDINGTLKKEVAEKWGINPKVRIEVKTRFHQAGNPHLFGIHKDNFDILVFVSLNKDYSVHYIGVVKKEDLPEVDNQNRIVYSDKLKIIYPKNIKFEQHK